MDDERSSPTRATGPLRLASSGGAPTLADVAERAGVSRQTVSNAVNNPDLLRPDTLVRVQAAVDELGYVPNRAARNLRTRASHLVGLRMSPVQEGTANAAMDRFVHSLVWTSREAGYHVLLFSGEGTDPLEGYEDLLRSTAVDAFVVTDTYLGNPQAAWLRERGCEEAQGWLWAPALPAADFTERLLREVGVPVPRPAVPAGDLR